LEVPKTVYEELCQARSKGQYFNGEIRDDYEFVHLDRGRRATGSGQSLKSIGRNEGSRQASARRRLVDRYLLNTNIALIAVTDPKRHQPEHWQNS
jgi:hypothetical protein